MLRYGHEFCAILCCADSLTDIDSVLQLLPKDSVVAKEELMSAGERFEYKHFFFVSSKRFSYADNILSQILLTGAEARDWGFKSKMALHPLYKYNMYAFGLRWQKRFYCMVAVPYVQMAWDLFPSLDASPQDFRLEYRAVNVPGLEKELRSEDKAGGLLRMDRILMAISGQSGINEISVYGAAEDILSTELYTGLTAAIAEKGMRFTPWKCRLVQDSKDGTRMILTMDARGNYKFRISPDGSNLPRLGETLRFLFKNDLLLKRRRLPLLRCKTDNEEDSD